ncbi:MAG: selenocysteine-specific translation factor [Acidimicrobiia bacterium]|nr:MAG: selenocysteine-specific translation factor [Acidimicrobiia bacterium]
MRTVATAGHVDHGKSALVLALTGTDPDRFPEEKARGLTIDLGFAFTTLPSGREIGFVDVPGHVRFVKNMLAGVGAVDVALLVVAANEGWMPQTEEHVRILDLLDVRHGVIALTKAALVDAQTVDLVRLELEDRLADTAAAGWPVVVCDAPTGRGLDELRSALDAVLAAAPPPVDVGRPRLWVDRVFSARGAGTVVTGTLTGGPLEVDADVVVEPGGHRARIRRIESRHERVEVAVPGSRVACNLAGVASEDVARGAAVVRPGQWHTVQLVDVALRAVAGEGFPRRARVQAHVGSGEHEGRLRLLDEHGTLGRLHLAAPLPLVPGDRVVLRSSGRQATLGGAVVLDLTPAPRPADARARCALPLGARVMAAHPWLRPDAGAPLTGWPDARRRLVAAGHAVEAGGWLVAREALDAARAHAVRAVRGRPAGSPGVEVATLAAELGLDPARMRAVLGHEPALVTEHGLVREAGGAVADDPAARALLDALDARPFDPPAPADVGASPALVRALVHAGALVDLGDVVWSAAAFARARSLVADALHERGALSVGEVRDLLGSSRRHVVPLLARLDAEGVTRRRGDLRVAGPRAGDRPG